MGRATLFSSVAFALLAYFLWQQRWVFQDLFGTSHGDIRAELGPQLSTVAKIRLPTDVDYDKVSQRWQTHAAPRYQAYVEPATEVDVQVIVKYANQHDIPFLAVSGGHAWTTGLRGADNGIGISMRKLDKMEINADGQSARLGGGLRSGEVSQFLASKRKRSLTGVECVGMLGAALGGGHGVLQGHYGLFADQILELRVVLANGSAVTTSADENPDLFWAMKGAGHNFGIVTEYSYRVYDSPQDDNWVLTTFIYTGDKVEEFYKEVNRMTNDGTDMSLRPPGMTELSLFMIVPEIDPVQPVILFNILYDGSEADTQPYAEPFHALGPIFTDTKVVPYSQLAAAIEFSEDSPPCQKGLRFQGFPISLQKYSVDTQRAVYDQFSSLVKEFPEFNRSWAAFEGYPLQAVRTVEESSTSVSDRSRNYIVNLSLMYWSPHNDELATKRGKQLQRLLLDGSGDEKLYLYIGYHDGSETTEELYGHDVTRVAKLQDLKREYDPRDKFSFYAQIR